MLILWISKLITPPLNLQQSTSSTTNVMCHKKGYKNIGDRLCSDYTRDDPRSKHYFCATCFETKRRTCNGYVKKVPRKEKSGNSKIQKLSHAEVVTKPSQVHPKMKEGFTSVTPLMEVIVYSKLTAFIIDQSRYNVLKMTLPFLSQLLSAKNSCA